MFFLEHGQMATTRSITFGSTAQIRPHHQIVELNITKNIAVIILHKNYCSNNKR